MDYSVGKGAHRVETCGIFRKLLELGINQEVLGINTEDTGRVQIVKPSYVMLRIDYYCSQKIFHAVV